MRIEDDRSIADHYRREAEQLRHAAGIVKDTRLQDQLLSFARNYDEWAIDIERKYPPAFASQRRRKRSRRQPP
jgi:hypothetical protein